MIINHKKIIGQKIEISIFVIFLCLLFFALYVWSETIGDENFISDVINWKDSDVTKKKREFSKKFDKVFDADKRKPN